MSGVLIWSFEHNAWWRHNSLGYTKDISEAGRYTVEEAYTICQSANVVHVHEALVPLHPANLVIESRTAELLAEKAKQSP